MTNLYTFRQHTETCELPCFIINEVLNPEECDKLVEDQKIILRQQDINGMERQLWVNSKILETAEQLGLSIKAYLS